MADVNIFSVDCDTVDCLSAQLGAINPINPCIGETSLAEINFLILGNPALAVDPLDWTADVGGWADVIDNADATDVKFKRFEIQGSIGEPDRTQVEIENGKQALGESTYTLTGNISQLSDDMYDFLRKLQCGSLLPKIWYEDRGKKMYGKADGILTSSVQVSFIKDTGKDALNRAEITITWTALTDPDRIDSPLQ